MFRDDYSGGQRVIADRVLDLTGARQEFGKRLLIRLNGFAEAQALRKVIQPYLRADPRTHPACRWWSSTATRRRAARSSSARTGA